LTIKESFLLGDQFGLLLLEGMKEILSCLEAIGDSVHLLQDISFVFSQSN
ncbi:hypothetical protein A2U01_0106998, partial [Trifolium medium]|nr:hypothetical protein [Trifolium medium]